MPESSIFHNFTITDEKAAERFADALDKAAQQPPWKPQGEVAPLIRNPEVIRTMFEKAKSRKESGAEDGGFLSNESEVNTEEQVESALRAVLTFPNSVAGTELYKAEVETFEEAGVLTSNRGLVLKLDDGSEYQLTIVKSR
ncbi:MAG: hypothetical protein LUG91_05210 [Ruminococcus sp.]|nr:hypothetical protein [Ruminococcus sp.]